MVGTRHRSRGGRAALGILLSVGLAAGALLAASRAPADVAAPPPPAPVISPAAAPLPTAPPQTMTPPSTGPAAPPAEPGPPCRRKDLTPTPEAGASDGFQRVGVASSRPCGLSVDGLIVLTQDQIIRRSGDPAHPKSVLVRPGAPIAVEVGGGPATCSGQTDSSDVVLEVQAQTLAILPAPPDGRCGDLLVRLAGPPGRIVVPPHMPVPPGSTAPPLARDRFLVASAAFPTPEHGFVLGAACHDTCTTRLLATPDGGQTWLARATLPVDLTPTTDLEALTGTARVLAADEQHLLVVTSDGRTSRGYTSSDGGRTFTRLRLGAAPLTNLQATADQGGFWLLIGTGGAVDHPRGRALRLAVDGRSSDLGPIRLGWMSTGAGSSWVVDDADHVTQLTAAGAIVGRGTAPCGGTVADGDELLMACQLDAAAGSGRVQVFASSDSGRSWPARTMPQLMANLGRLLSARGDRWVMANGGGASSVSVSDNAGHSWRAALTFGDGGAGIYDAALSDGRHGVLVHGRPDQYGGGNQTADAAKTFDAFGLWQTSDGGDSWRHVAVPLSAG